MYNCLATGSFLEIFCGPKSIPLSLALTRESCTKFVMACAGKHKILPCRNGILITVNELRLEPNPMYIY
jgi:hypothetical protein